MKSTKILATILTVLAVTSCSDKQSVSEIPLPGGDATISFDVSGISVSTYATEAEETSINTLEVFLAYKNGRNVDTLRKFKPEDMIVDGSGSAGFQITLAGSEYKPGEVAALYMIANGSEVVAKTKADLEAAIESAAIYTMTTEGALKLTGDRMVATRQVSLILKGGSVTEAKYKGNDGEEVIISASQSSNKLSIPLRRLASRVYVITPGGIHADKIKDYEISFDNNKLNSATGYFTYAGSQKGLLQPIAPYVMGKQSVVDQYDGKEAVGYLYPSNEEVILTVTSPHTLSRDVKFTPQANYHYKVTITPVGDIGLDFTISIQGYTEAEGDLEADFE